VTLSKKSKGSPYLIARDDPGSWQSACRWCESLGCPYSLPGLQLPSQPLRGLLPISLLGEQSWMDMTPLVYHNPSHSNQHHLFLFINSTRTKNATDEHDQQFSLMASSQCQWLPFNKLRMTKCKKKYQMPKNFGISAEYLAILGRVSGVSKETPNYKKPLHFRLWLSYPRVRTSTASRSVQPFLQGSCLWPPDRQTHRQTHHHM